MVLVLQHHLVKSGGIDLSKYDCCKDLETVSRHTLIKFHYGICFKTWRDLGLIKEKKILHFNRTFCLLIAAER